MKPEIEYLIFFLTLLLSVFFIMLTGKENDNGKK